MDLTAGTMVSPNIRLAEVIGEGGMGSVWTADHLTLHTRVAVKFVSSALADKDPTVVSRFKREASLAAKITSPHVVQMFDHGVMNDGTPFIVMELLKGESLADRLERTVRLSLHEAALLVTQVGKALRSAHKLGVVHRDIKPANIFLLTLDDELFIKVLDFGIAKQTRALDLGALTATGTLLGTPEYMSPEQLLRDKAVDYRADLWSLGVVAYQAVTGRLPFTGETVAALSLEICHGKFMPPSGLGIAVSAELDEWFERALSREAGNRFDSAKQMADAFAQAADGRAEHSLDESAPEGGKSLPEQAARQPLPQSPQPVAASLSQADTVPARAVRSRRWKVLAAITLVSALAAFLSYALLGPVSQPSEGDALHLVAPTPAPRWLMEKRYRRLVKYLKRRLDRPIQFDITGNWEDLARRLSTGEADLAILGAYRYVRAKRRVPSMRLLARSLDNGSPSYQGVIVARADSEARTLEDLAGKTFCYTNTSSTSGYLYPRALFRKGGMDPDRVFSAVRFSGGHLPALRMLRAGACDGAAVFSAALYTIDKGAEFGYFRILAATDDIPLDAVCASPRMPASLSEDIRRILLELKESDGSCREALGADSDRVCFVEAHDSDYDGVRKVERFLETGK